MSCALSARSSVHVPADSIERQAKASRRPAGEALLSSSTLPAVASDRGRDLTVEGRVALRQPLFARWCPCASSATGERRSSPVPEAPDLTGCSRAPHAPLAGRRGLRHCARRHPHAAAQRALVCNGSAAPRDEPRHLERLLSGGVTWPDRTVEAAVRRRHAGTVVWSICAAPAGPLLVALWERLTTGRPLNLRVSA